MELRSLHYFVRIAELGSITRAAAHLRLAQPALTRHVQRLEEELGVVLFTRANRGVRLTEAGEKLLEGAIRILRDVERTGDEIRAHDAHPSGRIILGITPTLSPVLVPELFARLRDAFPRVELKVMHAGMVRLEEFVIDGRVDIALLSELSRSRLIVSTPLAQEEMVLVTQPGARPAGTADGAELSRTPLVLGDGLRAAMDALLAGRGIELKVAIEVNDHETIRLMVQQGVAAAILPYSSVARECAKGLVEAHRLTEDGIFRTLALGVRVSRSASLAREAVGRTIAELVAAMARLGRLALTPPDRAPPPAASSARWVSYDTRQSPLTAETRMSAAADGFAHPEFLIETAALAAQLGDPQLRVFDCTVHLIPNADGIGYVAKPAREDFERGHIPGAQFIDLQADLSAPHPRLRFMLPSAETFAAAMGHFGVGDDNGVVIYSTTTPQWASRVWWMLRNYGFDNAAVLNGGFKKWASEGRPVETGPARSRPPAKFTVREDRRLMVGKEAVRAAIGDGAVCTLNALSREQHAGTGGTVYGRVGRIAKSVNVPAAALLDPRDGTYLPASQLRARFDAVGAFDKRQVITYCGGGIAASSDALVLTMLGHPDVKLYDASMSEWSNDPSLPMENGE